MLALALGAAFFSARAPAAHAAAHDAEPVVKRVAVVLFNFRDDRSQPFTVEQARKAVFTDPESPAAFYRTVSGGRLRLTGAVFGWLALDISTGDCRPKPTYASDAAWDAKARAGLAAQGVDLSGFDYVLYAMPSLGCHGGGRATVTCPHGICTRQVFIYNADRFLGHHVAQHELGHLIGNAHASRYDCHDRAGRPVAISADCDIVEYGDPFVVMGGGGGELDGYRRASLGWLAPEELQTATQSGSYALSPVELPGGVRALKVPKERDASGTVTSWYWLELRRPVGFDAHLSRLSPQRLDGLQIRIAPGEEKRYQPTYLVDTVPDEPPDERDEPLAPGRAFYDPAAAVLITNLGVSDGTLHVRVRLGVPADTAPPRVPARVWDGNGPRDADRDTSTSQNELYLSWTLSTDQPGGTGLAGYDYCIGTQTSAQGCAGTVVGAWAPVTESPADFLTGAIPLRAGRRYYGCVRARDNAGNVSQPRCSDGQVR